MASILDHSGDAVFAKNPQGRYLMINASGAALLGKSIAEIVGQDDRGLFGEAYAQRIAAIDRQVMASGKPCTHEETVVVNGLPLTLFTTTTAWYDEQGVPRGLIGTLCDVTERRNAPAAVERRDRLRDMASEIVMVEERLRRALAADLQNGLGQDIALTKMRLSLLRESSAAELHEPLKAIEHLVEQADRSVRSITVRISPPMLYDLGLLPALEWLVEDIGKQHGLAVELLDDGQPKPAADRIRVILFRAVRELLVNAATHGAARAASVRLAREDGRLRITVEDEGTGFDRASAARRGQGLFGIHEHLRHLNGSMEIESEPGRGTKVTLTAPLEAEPSTRS